jgi:hypothetical protein
MERYGEAAVTMNVAGVVMVRCDFIERREWFDAARARSCIRHLKADDWDGGQTGARPVAKAMDDGEGSSVASKEVTEALNV